MKLAALGNSITANAVGASGWANDGYLTWVRQLTGQRFNCHRDNVFATGGFTIAQIISTWLGPCVAAKPDICIVEAGHNSIDGVAGNTPTYQRELKLIFDALRNAGIYVVVMPIMVDSGGNAWNTQQTYQVAYLNNWAKQYCLANSGIVFADPNPAIIDFSTGNAVTGILFDGIHPSPIGAAKIAQVLVNVLNTLAPAADDRFTILGDTYDAANNVTGNLLGNGLLTGTGGQNVNGASGVIPSGWYAGAFNTTTMTSAWSQPAYAGYTNLTRSSAVLGGTADSVAMYFASDATGWATGDAVYAEAEIEFNLTTANIAGIALRVIGLDTGFATTFLATDGYRTGAGNLPTGATYATVMRTDPVLVAPGTNSVSCGVQIDSDGLGGAVSGTLNIARVSLRKVV